MRTPSEASSRALVPGFVQGCPIASHPIVGSGAAFRSTHIRFSPLQPNFPSDDRAPGLVHGIPAAMDGVAAVVVTTVRVGVTAGVAGLLSPT
ncbi:hypothetical protein KL864_31550 [Mycolicibacterium goodii]|uniref:hypothetical protein n=1 Tax=Mycolicibacterium goodii TaxID=134601 RepID=UPI001BDD9E3B|nr:hypothetical protein [Mycolicibacterium goodii]MBU8820414.1 hypothetical protein [Mycolicibacterium goodii]